MPTVTRREFLKVGVAGAGTLAVSGLGFDVALAKSNRIKQQLRIEGAKELHSICPYCAVGCALVAYTRQKSDGKTELLSPGEYDCTLRKTDGRWRFERRLVTMDRPFRVNDI